MQAQASAEFWDILLFWIFTGSSLLGLPPGERDSQLVKSVPPQTLVYFEWTARGAGQAGAKGIDGFAADAEVRQFFSQLEAALKNEKPDSNRSRRQVMHLLNRLSTHPGCLFLGFEPQPASNPGVASLIAKLGGLHGGIILSTGNETGQLWRQINQVLTDVPGFAFDASKLTQQIPIPIPGYHLELHREGSRIIVALGAGTLDRVRNGLLGLIPGLDTNPRFIGSLNRVAVPNISTIGWIDGQGIINSTTTALGPLGVLIRPVLTMLRVDALDHVVQSSGVEDGTMVQRIFVFTGGRTDGILVLLAGQPIQPQNLGDIPADADLAFSTSINLTAIYQEARTLLATARPLSVRVFDEAVKQFESDIGLKIVDDVLPAFGDILTAFDSPSAGGLIATSLVVSLEVRNTPKALIAFDGLMKLLERGVSANQAISGRGESVFVRRQQFLDHTVYCVNTVSRNPGRGPSLMPTFCLTDRHLHFSLHPQAMKSHLRFLTSPDDRLKSPIDANNFLTTGDHLFRGYLNGPRVYGIFCAAIPYLGQNFLSHIEAEGFEFDAFSIPSAKAVIPYFGDTTAVISRQKDGVLIETRNSPPVLAIIALLSAYETSRATAFESMEHEHDQHGNEGGEVQLGAVENGEKLDNAEPKQPPEHAAKVAPSSYRKLAPILLKALLPDDVQTMIPESTYRQLEEGPSPATIQRREVAKRKREERKKRRQELSR
jgi:hypothetical protein